MIKIMLRPAAPTASALACRDDRDTPLVSRADEAYKPQLLKKRKTNFAASQELAGKSVIAIGHDGSPEPALHAVPCDQANAVDAT
jgi:hypothetical protein